jgi:anti-anti-sigma regulatory factor
VRPDTKLACKCAKNDSGSPRARLSNNQEIVLRQPENKEHGGMLFETVTIEGITVVILRVKRLTRRDCTQLKREIAAAVDFRSPTIMDLGSAEHCDYSGLSLIVHWLAEGHRMGGTISICSNCPEFRALIELVRIPSFATVYSSRLEALDAYRPMAGRIDPIPAGRRVRAAAASGA